MWIDLPPPDPGTERCRTLFNKVTLDLRYFTTAETELGEAYRGRTVLSLRTSF
jgi:hypothetical protein